MTNILPCFYPTTVVFIDDNAKLLEKLVNLLGLENKPHGTFSNPMEGIAHLNKNRYAERLVDKLSRNTHSDPMFEFRIEDILEEAQDASRYHQPSVLVVDYEMPGMNGIQVCASLHNPYIKKILLTGVADEEIAVEAFNKGLIHQYIRKQEPLFMDHLQKSLKKAQQDYFYELFRLPIEIMRSADVPVALFEPSFIIYFMDLLKKHRLEEYYLVYPTGTFVMVSEDRQVHSLITLDEGLLKEYPRFLSDSDNPRYVAEAERVRENIEKSELIPCYYDPFNSDPFWNRVDISFHRPTVLRGETQTFFSAFGQGFIPLSPRYISFYGA